MKDWNLYHGTSSKVYESIQQVGFVLSEPRFHNWLAPQGIYLTPNRPLIARRFAKQTSRADLSKPVVLEVSIKEPKPNRVLDLTTDKGMNRFYKAYVKAKSLFSILKPGKLGRNVPAEYRNYLESVRKAHKDVLDKLEKANESSHQDPRRFNWDTVAIRVIVDEDKIQLIVTAIQEGTSFNMSFSNREPFYRGTPNYFGMRSRDHIEVCITDLSIIELNSFRIRPFDSDVQEFDEDFINWVTNIDAPDGVSRNS